MNLRQVRDDWVPPILRRCMRALRGKPRNAIQFHGDYARWEEAQRCCGGYHHEKILDRVLESTMRVVRGEAAFERDSVNFAKPEYAWPLLSALLWSAARRGGALRVVDYGGSLGSAYFQHRRFLSHLKELRWRVVEQPHFVAAGIKHLQDEHLRFHTDLQDACRDDRPDVVLASSVLQYLPDPVRALDELASIHAQVLLLDRTCFDREMDRAVLRVQRVPASIYEASYPCWFLDEAQIDHVACSHGYEVVAEFPALDRLDVRAEWKGKIFMRSER